MKYRNITLSLVSIACAALVAGCGGGGSAASPGTGGGSGATSGIVTQVAAATYPAGSNELAAFQRLNEQRGKCGFGLVAQNAHLDQAANAHRAYLAANHAYGHSETAGLTAFTGIDPLSRATAAGYGPNAGVGEVAGGVGDYSHPETMADGATVMESMLDLPYHAVPVLQGIRDVGSRGARARS